MKILISLLLTIGLTGSAMAANVVSEKQDTEYKFVFNENGELMPADSFYAELLQQEQTPDIIDNTNYQTVDSL